MTVQDRFFKGLTTPARRRDSEDFDLVRLTSNRYAKLLEELKPEPLVSAGLENDPTWHAMASATRKGVVCFLVRFAFTQNAVLVRNIDVVGDSDVAVLDWVFAHIPGIFRTGKPTQRGLEELLAMGFAPIGERPDIGDGTFIVHDGLCVYFMARGLPDNATTCASLVKAVTDTTIARMCLSCHAEMPKMVCACKAAKYCNEACQAEHWPRHKSEHKKLVRAGSAGGRQPSKSPPGYGDMLEHVSNQGLDCTWARFMATGLSNLSSCSDWERFMPAILSNLASCSDAV